MSLSLFSAKNTGIFKTCKQVCQTWLIFIQCRSRQGLKRPPAVVKYHEERFKTTIGIPPENTKTLEERLAELNAGDPILDKRIDIGLPNAIWQKKIGVKERLAWRQKVKNEKIQMLAEEKTLKVPLEEVKADWQKTVGPEQIRKIADHYGIFKDLFDHGYFTPCVPLDIFYYYNEDYVTPVHRGNVVSASDAEQVPNVMFNSSPDDLWTLILSNPDGHLLDTESEYLHWFIGNIKGSDISTGEVICDYLQPFPYRGSGYHRMVFILYKQDQPIDYTSLKKQLPCYSLKERTFQTFEFYKQHQDMLTPAGLAFYQCVWDNNLTDFFHNTLNMREPVFDYCHPPFYFKPQRKYPIREPFNLYLDRYRDPKEIKKEVLLKRLKMISPFEEEPPPPKYPNIYKKPPNVASWQKADLWKERNRIGKYRDLRPHSAYSVDEEFVDPFNKE